MNRIVLAVGGVVLLALAGWSALWFAGRDRIEARLDREVARLEARGLEVRHGARRVAGFPLAYEVTYEDVAISDPAAGIAYELPSITGVAAAEDVGRVSFRFPPAFGVTLTFDQAMREAHEGLPEAMRIDVEADGLVVETGAPDAAATHLEARAESLLAVSAGEGAPAAVAIELTGMAAGISVPRDPGTGAVSGRASVERLDYAVSALDAQGVRRTVEGISGDLMVSGESSLRTPEQWEALFAEADGPGRADFAYQAGESVWQIGVEGGDEALAGRISQEAGTAGGVVSIGDGRIELRASSENNRVEIEPAAEEAPVAGALTLDSFETVYAAPIAPAEELSEFRMRLALIGLAGDDALWERLDPEARLERAPANLIFEIGGTGRLTPRPEAAPGPLDGRPIEVGELEIAVASLQALGASLSAEGALEFEQPANRPLGTIALRGENVLAALGDLAAAGLLAEGTHRMALLLSSIYAVPGEAEGELVAEVAFTRDGVTVNGQPVQ